MSITVTIFDTSGRKTPLLYGQLFKVTQDTYGNLDYILTRVHKPCPLDDNEYPCWDV